MRALTEQSGVEWAGEAGANGEIIVCHSGLQRDAGGPVTAERAALIYREWDAGLLPSFLFLYLPFGTALLVIVLIAAGIYTAVSFAGKQANSHRLIHGVWLPPRGIHQTARTNSFGQHGYME